MLAGVERVRVLARKDLQSRSIPRYTKGMNAQQQIAPIDGIVYAF